MNFALENHSGMWIMFPIRLPFLFTSRRNPLFTSPESLFRIYRNPPFTSPGIRTPPRQRLMSGGTSPSRRGCAPG